MEVNRVLSLFPSVGLVAAVGLCAGSTGCDLIGRDLYLERLAELLAEDPRVPDPSGVLVRVIDEFGRPADGVPASETDGTFTTTDGAGLAWIASEEPTVVTLSPPGTAPTGIAVTPFDGYTGATLDLVPLAEHVLEDGVGTINEVGVRSIAFLPGVLIGDGDVTVPYAWGDGRAPPSDAVDLLRAVYLGMPQNADLDGSAVWRVRGDDALRAAKPSLYRFNGATAVWDSVGPVDEQRTWMEARLDTPGAWYAMAVPHALECVQARPSDLGSGDFLPGTELRVSWSGLDGARRVVTDEDGAACLDGQGPVTVDVLRGVDDGTSRTAWFDPGRAELLALGQDLDLPVPAAVDGDGDGALGAPEWDCDDTDPAVSPAIQDDPPEYPDQNCDGSLGIDADQDGDPAGVDCDDSDPRVSTQLEELCDNLDNDCIGGADDGDIPFSVEVFDGTCYGCGPETVAELNPIFYFAFDEIEEYTPDWSGWGRDLTVAGSFGDLWPGISEWDGGTPYWNGDIGQFMWLVDTDNAWPASDLTVSVWIRPEYINRSVLSYQSREYPWVDEYTKTLYGSCSPTEPNLEPCDPDAIALHEFDLNTKTSHTLVQTSDLAARFSDVPSRVSAREWTHLVFVREGQSPARLFVDGTEVAPADYQCDTESNVRNKMCPLDMWSGGVLRVGQSMFEFPQDAGNAADGDNSGVRAFEGVLDELAIFDRALLDSDVTQLFLATTCGEGLICNRDDEDVDGVVDEHLLGTAACPAVGDTACADINTSGSAMGVGPYQVDLGPEQGIVTAWCGVDGLSFCGDGELSTLDEVPAQESCDPGDSATYYAWANGCAGCVADVAHYATDCQDVMDNPALADPRDGAYKVDFDGDGPYPPVSVRCDMDLATGEAWTQVFRHDTRAGVLFNDPSDAGGACPAIEVCDNGVDETSTADKDPVLNGSSELADCDDPECVSFPTCSQEGPTPSPWRPENLLCPAPGDAVPEAYCGCGCPSKVTGDNAFCLGPLGSKFSVVDYLGAFQNASGQVQYRLRWPFHEESSGADPVTWCQDWLPFNDPAEERGHDRASGWCFAPQPRAPAGDSFMGLAPHGCDGGCEIDYYQFAAFDGIEEVYVGAEKYLDKVCSGLFTVGMNRGNGSQDSYGLPSNAAHFPDGSSKTVELWARRVVDGAGACPTPCGPP
jgi:hypothetical protein